MTLDQFAIPTQETLHIIHLKNYSEHNSITTNLGEFTLQEGHVSIRKKPMLTLFTTPYLKHALYVTYQDEGTIRKEKISYSPNGPSFYWGYSIVLSVSLLPLVFFLFLEEITVGLFLVTMHSHCDDSLVDLFFSATSKYYSYCYI